MTPLKLTETSKYALYGALFGLCFPIGSAFFLYFIGYLNTSFNLGKIFILAHEKNPLLYVIDTAPFFLGLFASLAGRRQDRILRLSQSLQKEVAEKTESLRAALEEAQKANETIMHMAEHDALTGLLNRRRFQKELQRWSSYALRYQRSATLIFIDLDKFKHINDTHGHRGGDEYLLVVADILSKALRTTDFVARWGGDEFAILLPETTEEAAVGVVNKLLKLFNQAVFAIHGQEQNISASIGLAFFPEHTTDISELEGFADAAMYEAKNAGGNCWRLYSASPQQMRHVQEHILWEGRIRRALENDQFLLLYQPLLNLRTDQTREYEALLRMEDRDGRLINPGLFLESAERFNLSAPIDQMVIRKTIRKIQTLTEYSPDIALSLNLSPKTLQNSELLPYIKSLLAETPLPPQHLGFEISESTVLENLSRIRQLAHELVQIGCRLILDDFGLGFASFNYLKQIPVDMIKVQGGLIRNIKSNVKNQAFVKDLAVKAHDFNIKVVAKFVEDVELIALLREFDVDFAQGFAIGRPLESIEQMALGNRVIESKKN